MIKYGDPNPLAVFNLRRLEFCPIHFAAMTFDLKCSEKTVSDWLYENTEGRFFLGKVIKPDTSIVNPDRQSAHLTMTTCVGFENHGEASYFALQLDQINKYEFSY